MARTTTTVFLFHPHLEASRVNARLAQAARGAGTPERPVQVRDLYALYPDMRIDVAAEHAALEAADRIVLQLPMYWYSSPALVKQWEDDVLAYGWAYGPAGGALHGKELALAVSADGSADSYTRAGSVHYELHELLRPFQATSDLIGTRFVAPFLTPGAMNLTDEELAERARDYAAWLTSPELPRLGAFE